MMISGWPTELKMVTRMRNIINIAITNALERKRLDSSSCSCYPVKVILYPGGSAKSFNIRSASILATAPGIFSSSTSPVTVTTRS